LTGEDESLRAELSGRDHIIAINKSDLSEFGAAKIDVAIQSAKSVLISAKSGAGLDQLRDAILTPFADCALSNTDFLITNARHADLLRRAAASLHASKSTIDDAAEDLILVGLYDSLRFLGEITGETTSEDVLSQIFSTFCIGK
jgi:tRNA modification GTPase